MTSKCAALVNFSTSNFSAAVLQLFVLDVIQKRAGRVRVRSWHAVCCAWAIEPETSSFLTSCVCVYIYIKL